MNLAAWVPAYIGLGSNLDDPPAQLDAAVNALAAMPASRVVAVSGYFRNPPMDRTEQPEFVNAVAGLLTRLPPAQLLRELKAIERARGREPATGRRWGPRVIDLDLLAYGRQSLAEPGLTVPHPGIAQRNFVLFPLAEIAPGLEIPGVGSVAAAAAHLGASGLERLS